jgi:hypothetical protein
MYGCLILGWLSIKARTWLQQYTTYKSLKAAPLPTTALAAGPSPAKPGAQQQGGFDWLMWAHGVFMFVAYVMLLGAGVAFTTNFKSRWRDVSDASYGACQGPTSVQI